ncbi:transcriptional regulator/antitoxin, MazE [Syntrophobotulus glycolicus DSM 8271]|uniref:Transcriptional regulator/antitoxin, MazE n=1 Tax=Syntrophobotulus glycolicus (strain DSM 8271 / FlGlyR) TaxID=645991 RepID=F0T0Q1_SYNGF|nr:AbrB/MazE/SpoVT family DNA-binding domain-containing protein [Syntrophobotulus glycolicus]ADY55116.1 transcriptional regulator/antitoxin, MazE [Syntrophobotulus glycolicus DSM 8271]
MPRQIRNKIISKSGGITIPSDIRREYTSYLGGEAVDLEIQDGKIILSPHAPRCMFCGSIEDIRKFEGRHICGICITRMAKEAKSSD